MEFDTHLQQQELTNQENPIMLGQKLQLEDSQTMNKPHSFNYTYFYNKDTKMIEYG